jgi:hypothetical protein
MRIAFNATVIPPTATPDIFQTTLSSLEVLNSPISSKPMRVARFLSGIFPSLVKVISDPYDVQPGFNAEDCKTWNRVETLLPLFADVMGLPSCENLNIPSILFFEGLRDPSLPLCKHQISFFRKFANQIPIFFLHVRVFWVRIGLGGLGTYVPSVKTRCKMCREYNEGTFHPRCDHTRADLLYQEWLYLSSRPKQVIIFWSLTQQPQL